MGEQAEIALYYRAAQIGTPAAFCETRDGRERLIFTIVKRVNLAANRVTLRDRPHMGAAAFFLSTGRNCRAPTQSHLIIPTAEMVANKVLERVPQDKKLQRAQELMASLNVRTRRVNARCLEPMCGHAAAVEVAAHKLSASTPEAIIAKLHCSKCGSKNVFAEWQ